MRPPRLLIATRALRAFADGYVALLLPVYLVGLGFSALRVGALMTATMLGSALLTLLVGLVGHRVSARTLLLASCALMLATGLAFSSLTAFWPLAAVAFVGTLNPSSGDVSVFLPLEQSLLAHAATAANRTSLFATYSLAASLAGALGALSVGLLDPLGALGGLPRNTLMQAAFALYGLVGLVAAVFYRRLPKLPPEEDAPRTPLGPSRRKVMGLAALFSLDSFGSGFVVNSLLALWLFHRFGVSLATVGGFFFWTGLITAFSQLAAPWLAKRIGLINTMVFTHIPASVCLVAAAFAPSLPVVFALMFVRAALSNMDVPARSSYVMAVVTPAERAAAAGVTNVPRSLAAAISPSIAGWLFGAALFPWPLVIGGSLKIAYDLGLWGAFSQVKPPEEDVKVTGR